MKNENWVLVTCHNPTILGRGGRIFGEEHKYYIPKWRKKFNPSRDILVLAGPTMGMFGC
jgi:hypothetical protein